MNLNACTRQGKSYANERPTLFTDLEWKLHWRPVKIISKAQRKKLARHVGYERHYSFTPNYWGGTTKHTWWCFDPASCAGHGNHCSECHSLICSECGCPCLFEPAKL